MFFRILSWLTFVLSMQPVTAQQWEIGKDKNGIKVFTAKEPSSKFKTIKVEATMAGTIEKLASVLKNVSNNKNWVYNTKQAYLLKRISEHEFLYYAETSLPWPLSNRDMAINMKFDFDDTKRSLRVTATGLPGALPAKEGLVRIPYFNGLWDVREEPDNKISIVYVLRMNPGGSISAGVSNMFVAKGPYETFNNLAKILRQ